jgi:hypothetical protein
MIRTRRPAFPCAVQARRGRGLAKSSGPCEMMGLLAMEEKEAYLRLDRGDGRKRCSAVHLSICAAVRTLCSTVLVLVVQWW